MLRKEETNPNQPMEATKSPEVKPWVRWVVAAAASNGFVSQLQPTPIPRARKPPARARTTIRSSRGTIRSSEGDTKHIGLTFSGEGKHWLD